tara:strand:- start:73 stop:255 length:183 start_codon:yes stop_codon:yes gene_type:complete
MGMWDSLWSGDINIMRDLKDDLRTVNKGIRKGVKQTMHTVTKGLKKDMAKEAIKGLTRYT